jgi:hypothetical protein
VTGTVTPTNTFPSGTTYLVAACPGSSGVVPGCTGLILSGPANPGGGYSLALPPGTWSILGFAITPTGLVAADQGSVVETVTAGEALTLNWTVTYPDVTGTITPTNTFPSGTTYGVAACPGSSGVVPGCTGLILASIAPSGGAYSLALPPGTWSILGFANGTPATPFLIGADQPYVVERVTAGEVLTLNWTVTYPG